MSHQDETGSGKSGHLSSLQSHFLPVSEERGERRSVFRVERGKRRNVFRMERPNFGRKKVSLERSRREGRLCWAKACIAPVLSEPIHPRAAPCEIRTKPWSAGISILIYLKIREVMYINLK